MPMTDCLTPERTSSTFSLPAVLAFIKIRERCRGLATPVWIGKMPTIVNVSEKNVYSENGTRYRERASDANVKTSSVTFVCLLFFFLWRIGVGLITKTVVWTILLFIIQLDTHNLSDVSYDPPGKTGNFADHCLSPLGTRQQRHSQAVKGDWTNMFTPPFRQSTFTAVTAHRCCVCSRISHQNKQTHFWYF